MGSGRNISKQHGFVAAVMVSSHLLDLLFLSLLFVLPSVAYEVPIFDTGGSRFEKPNRESLRIYQIIHVKYAVACGAVSLHT